MDLFAEQITRGYTVLANGNATCPGTINIPVLPLVKLGIKVLLQIKVQGFL